MATLMLSSLGAAAGGPFGAAIGSLVGQSIDRSLLGAGSRRGPRLGDLAVQTSAYGNMVPRIYGLMRVAGTVIWATDLKEGSELQGGSKGQPDSLTYSYSVSLAVALSSRPLRAVRRIWADGQLLRGSAGDFKVKTGFRFYPGSEDQPVDPLIASTEGLQDTPAYRGLALAVFEDLQLASFGNRIPILTFEVEADAGPPAIGSVLKDASFGGIDVEEATSLVGYAAYGQTVDDACAPLIETFNLDLHDRNLKLSGPRRTQPVTLAAHELGCAFDGERAEKVERSYSNAVELPGSFSVTFYDPSRDYQTGEQHATNGAQAGNRERAELPAVLSASAAKAAAESKLARRWIQREKLKLRLPPRLLALMPGDLVRIPDQDDAWQVKKVMVEGLVVTADLVRPASSAGSSAADAGASKPAVDNIARPTIAALLELPRAGSSGGLQLHLAASGGQTPWRPVAVQIGGDAGEILTATARRKAVIGSTLGSLAPSNSALLDLTNALDVEVSDEQDWLHSCDDEALAAGANLAAVGDELLQFGVARSLGPKRFRLSRLLRGRGGTEWAVSQHALEDTFVLLDAATLTRVELPVSAMNTRVSLIARGVADDDLPIAEKRINGAGVRPPSPVHLRFVQTAHGGVSASWVRRSRLGWSWSDEAEVPLGEATEQYRVRLSGRLGSLERISARANCSFTPLELEVIGGLEELEIAVAQIGDFGVSQEAVAPLSK